MFLTVARQHAGKYPYVDQIVKIVYDIIWNLYHENQYHIVYINE
jgi:hypothetical protein